MKSNVPWSVKGIERDARETAKEAARREGMTVGEWLNQIIYSHSEGGSPGALADSEVEGLKLRDIVTAIEHLRNRVVEAESKNARVFGELTRNMGGFVERVQRLERVKPAEGTYQDLAQRIDRIEQNTGDRSRVEALKALEKAVAQVAVQFTNAQRTTINRLDSAEAQLQEFAERIDRVGAGGAGEPAEVGALKSAIDNLSTRVARAEKIAGEAAALKEAAAGSADPEFVERTGARLRVLGDEIKRGGDQIRALEGLITKLSGQIEAAEKRSAEGVQKVADTIAEVRSQLQSQETRGETPDVEAMFAKARGETEAKLDALERSLAEMQSRVETMNRAPAPQPAQPAVPSAPAKPAMFAAPPAPKLSAPAPVKDAVDEIDEAVAALEADADIDEPVKDPFAFSDEMEAEAEQEAAAEAAEEPSSEEADDFRFELDEGEDDGADISVSGEDSGEDEETVEASAETAEDDAEEDDEARRDARSLLAEVRSALTGEGLDDLVEDDELGAAPAADDSEAEEEGAVGAADHEDGEDEQAPNTASLAAGMAIDTAAPKQPMAPLTQPLSAKEDLIQAARRRAQEAQAKNAEDSEEETAPARPHRSQLTAKQRAILAARARQKQAAQEAAAEPKAETPEPAPAMEAPSFETDESGAEDEKPAGRFGKFASALSAARAKIGRKKESDETEAAEAPKPAAEEEQKQHRNHDREALESIRTNSSMKKVTLAIVVAILLAVAALAFMMKDFVMKPRGGRSPASSTLVLPGPKSPQAAKPQEQLPEVPAAPAIDPKALYRESLATLGAASSESEAAAAIGKLEQSAALGFPPAQLQLGELYKTGQGVEQDFGQARVWFRRAANGGNVLAMHRLGVMTARGDGGPADSQEAISWFEGAANLGLVDSQYNLGAIYHPSGDGGSAVQSAKKAYYWYSLAAKNGDAQAGSLAAGVGATLSAAERAEIDAEVSEWSAEPANADANANAVAE
ncbi:MAG: tetratricopeptide repeat protein [Parvularculaceae bacterium]